MSHHVNAFEGHGLKHHVDHNSTRKRKVHIRKIRIRGRSVYGCHLCSKVDRFAVSLIDKKRISEPCNDLYALKLTLCLDAVPLPSNLVNPKFSSRVF